MRQRFTTEFDRVGDVVATGLWPVTSRLRTQKDGPQGRGYSGFYVNYSSPFGCAQRRNRSDHCRVGDALML